MPAFKPPSLTRSSLLQRHQIFPAQSARCRRVNHQNNALVAPRHDLLCSSLRSELQSLATPIHPKFPRQNNSRRKTTSALRSVRITHTTTPNALLQSSAASWISAFLIGLTTSAVLYLVLPVHPDIVEADVRQQFKDELLQTTSTPVADYRNMTGEALPGRPGTLTAEQEEKLRDLWTAVLRVFGVVDVKEVNGTPDASASTSKADASLSKKPKKKRLGLFRKKDNEDAESTTSAESSSIHTAADSEDKHGQTKEYQHALANQSPESLRSAFWSMVKHDHPDALLLRFLRARKWDVEKALIMMISTMSWRATEMHVDDDIMLNGELGAVEDAQSSDPAKKKLAEDFLTQLRMGKSFLHGLDKESRPMCFVRVRLHKQGEQSEESLERYTVFVIESARMILSPPVDTACVVFDMTGFSMANMDYAPLKFMIKCFEANYPESLGVVLIHKAPWIFQGVWKIIRGWLDPVVASKVNFTNSSAEMEAFVPESRILTELAGSEEWAYSYIEPVPGENDKMKDTETRDRLLKAREAIVDDYERVTLAWIHGEGEVESLKKSRHELADKLREDYWVLDPYIRARSYYDRVGLINPGGRLEFYKEKPVEAAVPAPTPAVVTQVAKAETSADDLD